MAVDASGNIFVPDWLNYRVQTFNSSGAYQSQFGAHGVGNGQLATVGGLAMSGGTLTIH